MVDIIIKEKTKIAGTLRMPTSLDTQFASIQQKRKLNPMTEQQHSILQ